MPCRPASFFMYFLVLAWMSCSSPGGGSSFSAGMVSRLNTIQKTGDEGHLVQAVSALTTISDSLTGTTVRGDLQLYVALKQADMQIAYCLTFGRGFDTATRSIRRLNDLHPAGLADSLKAAVLTTTGFYYYLMALLDHAATIDSALHALNAADSLYTALRDEGRSGRALFYIGLCYQNNPDTTRNNYGLAEDYFRRSLRLSVASGDKQTQSYACRHLAGICMDRGQSDSALTYAFASYRLREETGLKLLRPFTIGLIGDIYQPRNIDSAKKYHLMALHYADSLGYPPATETMRQSLAADDSLSRQRPPH